jgi:IS1 family transposase
VNKVGEYKKFIKENNIEDVLSFLNYMTYSSRLRLLQNLMQNFKVEIINMALREYYISYIQLERDNRMVIKNILKGLCNKYLKGEGKNV